MATEEKAPLDAHGEPLVCRPGQVFAGYEILRFLDSGGTCQIFEARHQVMERRVAIKMEKARLRAESTRARRIIGEARALALLDHPNVIRIHHADVDERVGLFIVMELLQGQDLRAVLIRMTAARRPIAIDLACSVAIQISDALGAFHRVGVLHRDLKPENVFVTNNEAGHTVKVLDLGLAKFASQRRETDERTMVGTAPYMAPEQLEGTVASHRSEVFSLGIILYEMLTGEHPFRPGAGPSPTPRAIAALGRIKDATYEPLSSKRSEAPIALARFVDRALAKLPENRPASMLEFRRDLERAVRAGESELANLDETAPLGTRAPVLDATAPFGTQAPDWWSPTSAAQAPLSDLGPTIRLPMVEVSPGTVLEPAPARPERSLPPFARDLSAELGSASLVLIEAPAHGASCGSPCWARSHHAVRQTRR